MEKRRNRTVTIAIDESDEEGSIRYVEERPRNMIPSVSPHAQESHTLLRANPSVSLREREVERCFALHALDPECRTHAHPHSPKALPLVLQGEVAYGRTG